MVAIIFLACYDSLQANSQIKEAQGEHMKRKQGFANVLIGIGIVIVALFTLAFFVLNNWWLAGLGSVFLLAVGVFGLAVWLASDQGY